VICWDRGRPARKRAEGRAVFQKWLPNSFRASRSFAGGTPAVPANHLKGYNPEGCEKEPPATICQPFGLMPTGN
jgi:hypothetical protein